MPTALNLTSMAIERGGCYPFQFPHLYLTKQNKTDLTTQSAQFTNDEMSPRGLANADANANARFPPCN